MTTDITDCTDVNHERKREDSCNSCNLWSKEKTDNFLSIGISEEKMISRKSILKFLKGERFVIVWWTLHLVGLLLIFGGRYPGILLLDLWLACSIACFALGSRRIKKLGAICLAFYAFFTLIVAGAMVYYLVYDGGCDSEVVIGFILPLLFITLVNLLIGFRTIKILKCG